MAFIYFFFLFEKVEKNLKKLELSPQNFRYDVLYPLYSGLTKKLHKTHSIMFCYPRDNTPRNLHIMTLSTSGMKNKYKLLQVKRRQQLTVGPICKDFGSCLYLLYLHSMYKLGQENLCVCPTLHRQK